MAMTPAMRNEIHTAAPATSPAVPSSEKIPAPTIEPTPMNAAWRTFNFFGAVDVASTPPPQTTAPMASMTTVRPPSIATKGHTNLRYLPYGTRAIANPPMTTADVGVTRFNRPDAL